jgi:hypothetical protein
MGKRELVLIAFFLILGAAVYRATAPARPDDSGFSLTELARRVRAEVKGEFTSAAIDLSGHTPVGHEVQVLHVEDFRGTLAIIGEERADVQARLTGQAFGLERAEAERLAAETDLKVDAEGEQVQITTTAPKRYKGRPPELHLAIRIPHAIRVEAAGRGGIEIRNVAGLTLRDTRGDVRVEGVRGRVDGTLRGGSLEIMDVDTVEIETVRTKSHIEKVKGRAQLSVEYGKLMLGEVDGETKISAEHSALETDQVRGPIRVEARHTEVRLNRVTSPIIVDGDDLEVRVALEAAVSVEIRNARDDIDVLLPSGGVTLDAEVQHGEMRMPPGVEVHREEDSLRATGPLDGGGPTILLRNEGGDITVRRR